MCVGLGAVGAVGAVGSLGNCYPRHMAPVPSLLADLSPADLDSDGAELVMRNRTTAQL